MKKVFRKSALDKIASVDQLDKMLKVTSPMSWLALLGITLILVFTVIWSIVGTLPSTVTASGVIVNADTATNTVLATQRGTVQAIVSSGQEVYTDTEVLNLATNSGTQKQNAGQVGTVAQVLVKPGDSVENGTELFRVIPRMYAGQKQMVVCYVPVADADKIKIGMEAHVTLTAANASTYGFMTARVVNVDAWAASQKAMASVVGSDNSMQNALTNNGGAVVAVACELYPDATSASGYFWSNEKGRGKEVDAPQMCSVKIITENVPPITKLFAKLKDIWENR